MRLVLVFLSLSALAACASPEQPLAGASSNVTTEGEPVVGAGARTSGYDFEGPKALPREDGTCAFFVQPE
jgi:hypothetical protein